MRHKLKKTKHFYKNMERIEDNGLNKSNKFLSRSAFFARGKQSHYLVRMISLVRRNRLKNEKAKTQKKLLWTFENQIYIMKRSKVNSFILP